MECQKDEASRAKELAEKKFIAKDTMGAMKLALKAQNLYPELKGIRQLIATLNVHISAEKNVGGEPDWYGVLGVNPQSDDEQVIREQYRKLVLMIHPDKNKAAGADEAFKLVHEAWSLLSDKARRLAYDRKTMHNFSTPKSTYSSANTTSAASSHEEDEPKADDPFPTFCHHCATWYKCPRGYLHRKLLCPDCGKLFMATEIPAPRNSWCRPWRKSKPKRAANYKSTSYSARNHASSSTTGRASDASESNTSCAAAYHDQSSKPYTFWTICHYCLSRYGYQRSYLNCCLRCHTCGKEFIAIEIRLPNGVFGQPWPKSNSQPAANKSTTYSGRNHAAGAGAGFKGQSNFKRKEAQAATETEEAMRSKKHHATKRANDASSTDYANVAKKRKRCMEDDGCSAGRS